VKHGSLLVEAAYEPIGNLGHFFSPEHADEVIDAWPLSQQRLALALCKAARYDDAAQVAGALKLEHLVDRCERFLPGRFDKPARVHHGEVSVARVVHKLVPVELEHAEHTLAVDEVLRASEANERVTALRSAALDLIGESVWHGDEGSEKEWWRRKAGTLNR
jgi:hypothetical protein